MDDNIVLNITRYCDINTIIKLFLLNKNIKNKILNMKYNFNKENTKYLYFCIKYNNNSMFYWLINNGLEKSVHLLACACYYNNNELVHYMTHNNYPICHLISEIGLEYKLAISTEIKKMIKDYYKIIEPNFRRRKYLKRYIY